MSSIEEVDILQESKDCFLTYAEEVLTDRAIPAVEDGLLSAQRKILWTMEDYLKMNASSKTKKCNAIIGSTLATSYFHGDASCYGVLCKMSQKFLMRYPLIDGQGSLGTQESNDMVASSRYTEAKPSTFTDLMMTDFKKNVVPKKETYNGEFMEPIVLPGTFPNALCNGRQAIGISMSHNSAPNNLTEVCNGIIHYIEKDGKITIAELMQDIPGPDFPLGGEIINIKDVKTAFETGRSSVSLKIRGDYEIEKNKIIFTSIPYRTYRNKIKEQISKNIEELEKVISDFDDESNIGQNRLVFTAKSEACVPLALKKLFSLTDLQTTLSYNMNFIVNGTPKLCSLYDLVKYYVDHQENVLLKATEYDKNKAEERLHILLGLLVAIDQIDEVIKLIKQSNNKNDARTKIIELLNVDETQANAILDMRLSKLTHMDKTELVKEKEEKEAIIKKCITIITDKNYRNKVLISMVEKLKSAYGDKRRTKLNNTINEDKDEDLIKPEECVVVMTESGLVKRVPATNFKLQKRNGKGVKTQNDITISTIRTNTVDSLMVFTDKGKMYRLSVNDIPEGNNTTKGQPIKSLVTMEDNEKPQIIYSIYKGTEAKYVFFATKKGLIKKTPLSEFIKTKRKTGIVAIKLKEDDELASVSVIEDEKIILLTANGMGIKIDSAEVASIGRSAAGIKGINLKDVNDIVVAVLPIRDENDYIAIFTEKGMGKKIKMTDLVTQKRAGMGVICYKPSTTTGRVKCGALVSDEDNILICGKNKSIFISAKDVPLYSKIAKGNILLKENNLVSVSKV